LEISTQYFDEIPNFFGKSVPAPRNYVYAYNIGANTSGKSAQTPWKA
jgi:hypothetical protein